MSRALTLAGYAVIAITAVIVEIRARSRGTATIATAFRMVLRHPAGRAVMIAAWLWLGWHVFVRVADP